MGIISRFLNLFRKKGGKSTRRDLSGLSRRLGEMRGRNITIVDSGDNLPPNRDGIENLAAAARDARYVDRTNEDKAISNLRSYRKLKKRSQR